MKITPEEQVLKEKENKQEPLCLKCVVEMEFDCNELIEKHDWHNFFSGRYNITGNGWFECPLCKKRYLVKDYAKKTKGGLR